MVEPIVLISAALISIWWFIFIIYLKGLITKKDTLATVFS